MMAAGFNPVCSRMEGLPEQALQQVAAYFQALSEPTRLQILNLLRQGERSVGELAQACGCTSANVSRHLTLLAQHGLVQRESRGNSAFYRIADPAVYQLCDLVCGNIARQIERSTLERAVFMQAAAVSPSRSPSRARAPRRTR
ncbi:putative transcriptional regulator [Burkholderiales bacterium JOSHI_001]|nr:putative transcriptional regulator [Burkholderiales bacterium JOSHI_001]